MNTLHVFAAFCIIFIFAAPIKSADGSEHFRSRLQTDPGDGLTGRYFQGYKIDSTGLITFEGLTEAFSRVDTLIDFWNGNRYYAWQPVGGWGNNYSIEWSGYIFIEQAGDYGFGTISDDGSQILIDSVLIVDNGERQWYDWEDNISEGDTANTPFPPLTLDSGFHAISVRFYENASYDGIELWWLKPGADSSDIPYYGTNFHGIPPTYNPNTNWEIVPKNVLFTKKDTVSTIIRAGDGLSNRRQVVELFQNYPNPFNPATVISWQMATGCHVELSVYNLLGKKVAVLISRYMGPGKHSRTFDGSGLASGIYYYQLVTGTSREIRKMVLLR